MTTSLENPLSSLSSGYFSDSTSFKVKPTVEDIQVVDHEDDEPSVLATKSFLSTPPTTVTTVTAQQPQMPKNLQEVGAGFSHLEWSSSVPFNVAEEPDDVQGMS